MPVKASPPLITVAIPTLNGGHLLADCVGSLITQSMPAFEVIVINNGDKVLTRTDCPEDSRVRILKGAPELGFGESMNRAIAASNSMYFVSLNDDTIVDPAWLQNLLEAMEASPQAGMCASQIRLIRDGLIDSAGMVLTRDGTSKQRGYGRSPQLYSDPCEVLLPSGCAALYRREALSQAGQFDESFFMYCEDTELGLRIRRAGWTCVYVPSAVVYHHYSATAGANSAFKVYYVERNRLAVLLKHLPWLWILWSPAYSFFRYLIHASQLSRISETMNKPEDKPWKMIGALSRAYYDIVRRLPGLLADRRRLSAQAKLSPSEFRRLLHSHTVSMAEALGAR